MNVKINKFHKLLVVEQPENLVFLFAENLNSDLWGKIRKILLRESEIKHSVTFY